MLNQTLGALKHTAKESLEWKIVTITTTTLCNQAEPSLRFI